MENAWLIIAWAFIFLAVFAEVRRLRAERKPSPIEDTSYFDKIEEYRRDFE
jgi:hypothetical protein